MKNYVWLLLLCCSISKNNILFAQQLNDSFIDEYVNENIYTCPSYYIQAFSVEELCNSSYASQNGISNIPNATQRQNLQILINNYIIPLSRMYNGPIAISSGFRGAILNAAVGGSSTSNHLKGQAVDLSINNSESGARALWELAQKSIEFDECYLESKTTSKGTVWWLHLSYRSEGNRMKVAYLQNNSVVFGKCLPPKTYY